MEMARLGLLVWCVVAGVVRGDNRCVCTEGGDCPILAELYEATIGASWINNTGWCGPGPTCSWHGIGCWRDRSIGRPTSDVIGRQRETPKRSVVIARHAAKLILEVYMYI